jgi:hypothetical protein
MGHPPSTATEAVELLVGRCPELEAAWRELCEQMETDTGDGVGIFTVFSDIILPLLLYAIDGQSVDEDWVARGAEHRSHFVERADWMDVPRRGTAELGALVHRIYEVLDLWAASQDINLRDAVYIEMVETGYVDLTVDDLLRSAGPALRGLAATHPR